MLILKNCISLLRLSSDAKDYLASLLGKERGDASSNNIDDDDDGDDDDNDDDDDVVVDDDVDDDDDEEDKGDDEVSRPGMESSSLVHTEKIHSV